MRISIFGLGYVGVVSAGCLANEGHRIIGVDPVQTKVDMINSGQAPIIEKDINTLIFNAVDRGLLKASTNTIEAVNETVLSIVCVGTPSMLNGNLDLKYISRVCEKIGTALRNKSKHHVIVIRSTILPGTMQEVVIPVLQKFSGKQAGIDFGVCNNPEFMREGSAVYDYGTPPKTVIGETDKRSGDLLASLYEKINAPLIRTDIRTAVAKIKIMKKLLACSIESFPVIDSPMNSFKSGLHTLDIFSISFIRFLEVCILPAVSIRTAFMKFFFA